ncbi:MAG: hypothetical protein ACRCXZ_01230 [Patescibacteria group bacterium]
MISNNRIRANGVTIKVEEKFVRKKQRYEIKLILSSCGKVLLKSLLFVAYDDEDFVVLRTMINKLSIDFYLIKMISNVQENVILTESFVKSFRHALEKPISRKELHQIVWSNPNPSIQFFIQQFLTYSKH